MVEKITRAPPRNSGNHDCGDILNNQQMIHSILFEKALALHKSPRTVVTFSKKAEYNALLNDIETYPHLFVLGCIMNLQSRAESIWNIPCRIAEVCGGPEFEHFLTFTQEDLNQVFRDKHLHRFKGMMPIRFYKAVQRIHTHYGDNAANIWLAGKPTCKEVIDRFDEFDGVGQKISTMATNILVRDFKVTLPNVNEIDISVDVQIEKVYKRMGIVPITASRDEIIAAARKIYPDYPGFADSVIWEIGSDWCKPDLSGCCRCFLDTICPKVSLPDCGENPLTPRESGTRTTRSRIKPGKYRPEFEQIIRQYQGIVPENFQLVLTSGKTNVAVKSRSLPESVHYEFVDWGSRISIELMANRLVASQTAPLLMGLSQKEFPGLPSPRIYEQDSWVRIQFFVDETGKISDITDSMNRLIDLTYSHIKKQ